MQKILSLGFLALASMVGLAMCYGGGGGFQKMGGQQFMGGYPKYMPRMNYGYSSMGAYGGGGGGGIGLGGGGGGGIIGLLIFLFIFLFVIGLLFDNDSGSGGLGIGK